MSTSAPVAVLVHGIMDRGGIFGSLQGALEREGIECSAPDLTPNHGGARLEVLAEQLLEHIDTHVPRQRPVHLLGFSMGAIVSRYYLQRLGGMARAAQFLSVCAPHRGTQWSWLGPLAGMRQMRPGSPFLRQLNDDLHTLTQRPVTCYWTPLDLVIVPATSSTLSAARNVRIQSMCHACILRHPQLLSDVTASILRVAAAPEAPGENPHRPLETP